MNLQQLRHRDEFPEWLNANGLLGEGVEVGVFEAEYSDILAAKWNGRRLVGVDPFINYPNEIYHDGANRPDLPQIGIRAEARMKAYPKYVLFKEESLTAVNRFAEECLDFVYLDANHDYPSITKDIAAWWPKLKRGGVMGCHDQYSRMDDGMNCGVDKAVLEFIYANALCCWTTPCTTAWITKP